MMQLLTRDFRQRRADQLQRLKEWEDEINEATVGQPRVTIENNVDLDEPPVGFTYVTQCKVTVLDSNRHEIATLTKTRDRF